MQPSETRPETGPTGGVRVRARLQSLWIFFLFNVLFRDLHDLFLPGRVQQILDGVVDGTEVTAELLLMGGAVLVGVLWTAWRWRSGATAAGAATGR